MKATSNVKRPLVAIASVALLAIVLAVSLSRVLADTGSNQGSYGANFAPATLSGQVTKGGVAQEGAVVATPWGHRTTTDAAGKYVLWLEAPGIISVTAYGVADSSTASTEVSLGRSPTLTSTSPLPPTSAKIGNTAYLASPRVLEARRYDSTLLSDVMLALMPLPPQPHCHGDTLANAYSDTQSHLYSNTDGYGNSHAYCDPDRDAHANTYTLADAYADRHGHANPHPGAHCHRDSDTRAYGNGHSPQPPCFAASEPGCRSPGNSEEGLGNSVG